MSHARAAAAGLVLTMLATLSCSGPPRRAANVLSVPVLESGSQALVPGRPGGTFRLTSDEPLAIDPSNVADGSGLQITAYLFTGLVIVAPDGSVSPGVATEWRPNPDCSQWTFRLRQGTRFHDGEEVTSASFARAWQRANGIASAYLLEPISAVDASDPYVLGVTLAGPDCEFLRRMIHPVFSPVPSSAGPVNNQAYNDHPIGNGPFMMDGPWRHDRHIRLVRYDGYQLGDKANLAAVDIAISMNPAMAAYNGFRAGAMDWARVQQPASLDPAHQLDGTVISSLSTGTAFLLPMVTTKPLDSAAARKAISLAIDRDAITRDVFQDGRQAATSLVPPLLWGPSGACDACRFDPDAARRLAASAGLTPGTVLHFRFNDDSRHEKWTVAIKRQLETTLGLRINYYGLAYGALVTNERAPGASGISRSTWVLDYPSREDILAILRTSAIGAPDPAKPATGDNMGRYSNPRFDQLLDRAKVTVDNAERTALYRQAENIAIGDDLAVIPLWYRLEYRLVASSRFTNLRMDWNENADLSVISVK